MACFLPPHPFDAPAGEIYPAKTKRDGDTL